MHYFFKLKFVDEASVRINAVGKPCIVGPKGEERFGTHQFFPNARTRSIILLTTLSDPRGPIYFEFVDGTTTSEVFRNFVTRAAAQGWLGAGDYLIMDNARIHSARAVIGDIDEVLGLVGATRVNLPAYSPELNPCEFVFGNMQDHIDTEQDGQSVQQVLTAALGSMTREKMFNFYLHCTSVALNDID